MWDLNKARVLHTTETHITVKNMEERDWTWFSSGRRPLCCTPGRTAAGTPVRTPVSTC